MNSKYIFFLSLIAINPSSSETKESLNILATKGDFSYLIINEMKKEISAEINVTFADNEYEMHDKLIRSNGIVYDIAYESGMYLELMKINKWIDPIEKMIKDGKISTWKKGIYVVVKDKKLPEISWNEIFNSCSRLDMKIQLTNNGAINSVIASEDIDINQKKIIELKNSIFKRCRFSMPGKRKSIALKKLENKEIEYAVYDNESAQRIISTSDKINFYIPDEEKTYGWSKNWVVLNSTKNEILSKIFISKISDLKIVKIEAKMHYSSFSNFENKDKPLINMSKKYNKKREIIIKSITMNKEFEDIQLLIVENSGDL